MARMIAEVYDALLAVGVPDDKVRAAATALADPDAQLSDIRERLARIETRLGFHRWAFALMVTLQITILVRVFWPA